VTPRLEGQDRAGVVWAVGAIYEWRRQEGQSRRRLRGGGACPAAFAGVRMQLMLRHLTLVRSRRSRRRPLLMFYADLMRLFGGGPVA